MDDVLHTEHLVGISGPGRSPEGVTLRVEPGRTHALLGPGGSGKTPVLQVLLGLRRPAAGTARVFGRDPYRDRVAVHRRLAYVPQRAELWPDLTVGEVLDGLARLRRDDRPARRAELVERFRLDPSTALRDCPDGRRPAVLLVSALASATELLVLDDPFAGLDPESTAALRECLHEQAVIGRTVLLAARGPAVVCDRWTVVAADGASARTGRPEELAHMLRTAFALTGVSDPGRLAGLTGVHDVLAGPDGLTCEVDAGHVAAFLGVVAEVGVRGIWAGPRVAVPPADGAPADGAAPAGTAA